MKHQFYKYNRTSERSQMTNIEVVLSDKRSKRCFLQDGLIS